MKTNCPNCGAPVYIDRRSCPYCGTAYSGRDDEVTLYADNRPIILVSSVEIELRKAKINALIEAQKTTELYEDALKNVRQMVVNSILTPNEARERLGFCARDAV